MILGDNIFHGTGLGRDIVRNLPSTGAHIFTYEVSNPSDYGVLEVGSEGNIISITEKPNKYISNLAVTGLYYFDGKVSEIAQTIKPSSRGEMEITSVIDHYLQANSLTFTRLSRGTAWLDTGRPDALNDASAYVRIIEERTGLKIGCIEEIAFQNEWISGEMLLKCAMQYPNSYGEYLSSLIKR
jgi:glucose-1-phosphate thymidylyltransferase